MIFFKDTILSAVVQVFALQGEAVEVAVELAELAGVGCCILTHFEEGVHVEQVKVERVLVLWHQLLVAETWFAYQRGLLLEVPRTHMLVEGQVHVVVHHLGLLL